MNSLTSRDGTEIAYSRAGDGLALVLVDGALSHRSFGPMPALAALLEPRFTVLTYDRRGRGASGDAHEYAVAREVEDLDAVIGAAGGSARVFGLSSGAALGLEATAAGLPITRLALYEPPFTVDGGDPAEDHVYRRRLDDLLADGRRGDAVAWFLSNAGVPDEALAEMRDDPSWAEYEALAPTLAYDHDVLGDGGVPRNRAAHITAPTLVAHGALSPDFFGEAARATADAIPGGRHLSLDGQAWGRPAATALAPVLIDFLS
jgi:pimeloyl-ACP methyl ester carboxylesterase